MFKDKIKKGVEKTLYIKSEISWNRNINRIYNSLGIKKGDVDEKLITEHVKYWSSLKKNVSTKWFEVYNFITNNPDIRFIPENIYFNIIEPKLNNRKLAAAYADKNFYEIFYDKKDLFPESILRNINGSFYDRSYNLLHPDEKSFPDLLSGYDRLIVKPSTETGGGKRILMFQKKDGKITAGSGQVLSLGFLKKHLEMNYIIQNYISQNNAFAQFNNTSLNTIRIFTYRSVRTDEVIPLHAVLRIGKKGNYIDDQNVGGVACSINESNKLNSFGTDILGKKYYEFNGMKFSNIKMLPKVDEMRSAACNIAKKNIHSRVLGFDFAVDENENIRLIEINHLWTGINFFQMNSSSVLGKYTDEVIEFCKSL